MNYYSELKAFPDWLMLNPSITSDDITLWYTLMTINNASRWQQEFTVAISTLMDRTRLSRSAIYRSRNRLVQLARINVKERPGNQAAVYQMIPLASQYGTQENGAFPNGTQVGTQPGTQVGTQPGTQPRTINNTIQDGTGQSSSAPIGAGTAEKDATRLKAEEERKKRSAQKKKELEATPHWRAVVSAWFKFNKDEWDFRPSFKGKDPKCLKTIADNLQKRSEAKNIPWTEDVAIGTLINFLRFSITDKWLKDNFLLSNLEQQLDKLLKNANNGQQAEGKSGAGLNSGYKRKLATKMGSAPGQSG